MEDALGASTGGLWTPGQAREAGVTPAVQRGRVARGEWQVVRRGVLTDGGVEPDARVRAWAAVLAAGGRGRARAAGRTSARLYGLPLVDDADPLLPASQRTGRHDDVAVLRGLHEREDLHPVRLVVLPHERVIVQGVPCLSPLRTLVDLARLLDVEALVCALDAALHRGLVTPEQVRAEVLARRGHPFVDVLRRAATLADGRSESPLESLSRLLLRPVVPGLVPQVRVLHPRTFEVVARIDLGDEALRFGVEADGAAYHSGRAAWAADRAREHRLRAHGWLLERVTWADVRRDRAATADRVRAAAGERRAA